MKKVNSLGMSVELLTLVKKNALTAWLQSTYYTKENSVFEYIMFYAKKSRHYNRQVRKIGIREGYTDKRLKAMPSWNKSIWSINS